MARSCYNILKKIRNKYLNKNLKVLIVGAGALANFVALGLAELKLGEVMIMDDDEVEEHNLNRQILYYDSVGEKKAKALARELWHISPLNRYKYIPRRLTEKSKSLFYWFRRPDIIMDCVDNFKTRSILNNFATYYGIPLISGGISPFDGQLVVYVPDESACLNCEIDVNRLAKITEQEQRRRGCLQVAEGSVVTTNQIIGGIMVAELKMLLEGRPPLKGILKYSSRNTRTGIIPHNAVCDCHQRNLSLIQRGHRVISKIKGYFNRKAIE